MYKGGFELKSAPDNFIVYADFFYIPHENEIFCLKRGFKLHEFPLYPPLKKLVLHYK